MHNTILCNLNLSDPTEFSDDLLRSLFNSHRNNANEQLHYSFFNTNANPQVLVGAVDDLQNQISVSLHKMKRFDVNDLLMAFFKIVDELAKLNPVAVFTQFTSANSLVIKSETAKGNIYFELFFDEDSGWLSDTALNIFLNKELQLSQTGVLDKMILELREFSGSEEMNYFRFLNQVTAYELPRTDSTTAELQDYY